MIEYIHIRGYRSIRDKRIDFKSGINLLIGENDAGKSSILNCVRLFSQDYVLGFDDDDFHRFYNGTAEELLSEINVEIKFFGKQLRYKKIRGGEEGFFEVIDLVNIQSNLDSQTEEELKDVCKRLGGSISGRQSLDGLKTKIRDIITAEVEQGNNIKEFPVSKSSFLVEGNKIKYQDGKHFENINNHFKSFVKDQINKIRDTEVSGSGSQSLRSLVDNKLDGIKEEKKTDYKNNLLPTLQEIIPGLIDLNVRIESQLGNFNNYEIAVDFIGGNSSNINVDKKGDGTRRRITLSLFKFESEKANDEKIYIFDEPDTHLHVKAQQDLYDIINKLTTTGNQIIFTSHSPYLLNLLQLSHVQLVESNNGQTDIKSFQLAEYDQFEGVLSALGIQNIHVFFTKHFVFVEGDTEEQFFTRTLFNQYGVTFERKFAKLINAEGVSHEAIFASNLHSILGSSINMVFIVDSDYTNNRATKNLVDALKNKFTTLQMFALGKKEFEDLFPIDELYECFQTEFETIGKTIKDLETLLASDCKFSEALSGITKLSKPQIGVRLADYYKNKTLPSDVKSIVDSINNLS